MDGDKINKSIRLKLKNYINHKSKIIEERVYWMCIDMIFEAQNYDDYEIDTNNNIYVSYSLTKDESIINQPHDPITSQIIKNYRRNLKFRLGKDNLIVKFKEDDIYIYFSEEHILNINNTDESVYCDSDSDSDSISNIDHAQDTCVRSMLDTLDNCEKNINVYKTDPDDHTNTNVDDKIDDPSILNTNIQFSKIDINTV